MPNVRISEEEILVLGGGSSDGRLSSAELLNIAEGTSTLFESMTMPRTYFLDAASANQRTGSMSLEGGELPHWSSIWILPHGNGQGLPT